MNPETGYVSTVNTAARAERRDTSFSGLPRSRNPAFCRTQRVKSRVESRTGAVALASRWLLGCFRMTRLNPVWRNSVSCSRSSNRTGRFPASGSRKRLTLSPTEGWWSGGVTGPSQTRSAEMLPESAGNPVAAHCVCRIATDAASGGRAYPPHCRLC